jgi:hypothetical protein
MLLGNGYLDQGKADDPKAVDAAIELFLEVAASRVP